MMNIILLGLLLLYVSFRERFLYFFAGRAFPILEFPLLLAGITFLFIRLNLVFSALKMLSNASWLPYLVLGVLLPLFGVVQTGYPVTSLYNMVITVFCPISAFVFGASLFHGNSSKKREVLHILLNCALLLQMTFVSFQVARQFGYSGGLIDIITEWDINSQSQFKEEYIITGRAIGTFINPNVLGVWAVICFFWNLIMATRFYRLIFCGCSLFLLLASQSRGSAISLFIGALLYGLWSAFGHRIGSRRAREIAFIAVAVLSVLIFAGLIAQVVTDTIPGMERWKQALGIVTRGAEADENFSSRLLVWREAIQFMEDYPFGTFGPPQVLFVLPPDNMYIYCLLQGSVFYLFALICGFVGSITLIFRGEKFGVLIALIAAALAVNSMTALPLLYSPSLLYWYFLGVYGASGVMMKSPSVDDGRIDNPNRSGHIEPFSSKPSLR